MPHHSSTFAALKGNLLIQEQHCLPLLHQSKHGQQGAFTVGLAIIPWLAHGMIPSPIPSHCLNREPPVSFMGAQIGDLQET